MALGQCQFTGAHFTSIHYVTHRMFTHRLCPATIGRDAPRHPHPFWPCDSSRA